MKSRELQVTAVKTLAVRVKKTLRERSEPIRAQPKYGDCIEAILSFLTPRALSAPSASPSRLAIDPTQGLAVLFSFLFSPITVL